MYSKQVQNCMVLIIKAQKSDYVLSTYCSPGTLNVKGEPHLVIPQSCEAGTIVIPIL